ncbi:MAG TPA: phosphatase PAP2 family protein [Chitinophagaceae bacterium]|nr:phosphatase PAP2 family protein [Chitinophagaceae bacterium]
MKKNLIVLILIVPLAVNAQLQNPATVPSKDSANAFLIYPPAHPLHPQFLYEKPRPFTFLTNVPRDLIEIAKTPFEKNNLKGMAIVAAATAILLPLDQRIMNSVGRTSHRIGLGPQVQYDKILQLRGQTLFTWPDNLNSTFYQLGEGTTTLGMTGLLFVYGRIAKDYRSLQTASDLLEAYISMGITVQTLKRIAGRQAPFKATIPGGRWRPFPSFSKYQRYTTEYDAFPSGHLATMMATTTVLAENYPEKKWIRPLGYLLTGLTGWSMVNNRVHWTSDFPLGLGIGYLAGKLAYKSHHKKEQMLKVITP